MRLEAARRAGLEPAIVLSVLSQGMPLIYSGQEAGNARRLNFFERDPIEWREHPIGDLYKKLFALKKANTALWNGAWGATMIHVPNSVPDRVFSFVRQNGRDKAFVVINFSDRPQRVTLRERLYHGRYVEYFSQAAVELTGSTVLQLEPWSYCVFVK